MNRARQDRRRLVCAVSLCFVLLACGASDPKPNDDGKPPAAPAGSPFAHIEEQPPGGQWLAPAKNRQNLVREFRVAGSIYLVGVSLPRLVAVAYDVHPRDVALAETVETSHFDAVVHARDRQIETARGMLRSLIDEQLGLEVHRERSEAMSMVLGPAINAVALQPSKSRRGLLELREGELRAIGSPISKLVYLLRESSEIPLVDETLLTEHYDYLLEWDPKKGAYAFIQSLGDVGLVLSPGVREVERLVVVRPRSVSGAREGDQRDGESK